MMHNEIDGLPPEYGELISKLSNQINELFSKLHYYQGLIAEKEIKITQLNKVNNLLKSQIRDLSQISKAPTFSSQESYIPPVPKRKVVFSGHAFCRKCNRFHTHVYLPGE